MNIIKKIISAQDKLHHWWLNVQWKVIGEDAPIVLLFHEILPIENNENVDSEMQVFETSFEKLLTSMLNDGWTALSEAELLTMVQSKKWRRKCFYVTFDDAHESVFSVAFPILERLSIPFTVFLTNDLLNKPNYLSIEQVIQMKCSIGGHGEHHKVFRHLTKMETTREYNNNKVFLEEKFKKKVTMFAYPFGGIKEVSHSNIKLLRQGFDLGFSTYEGTLISSWWTGQYFLPRVNVSETFVERFTQGKFLRYEDYEGMQFV